MAASLVPRPHSQLRMDYITATREVVGLGIVTVVTSLGVSVAATLINGVIGQ